MTEVTPNPVGYSEALIGEVSNPETPRKSGHKLHALGKEWTMSSCELRIKAQFEEKVRGDARKMISEIANTGDVEEASLMRSVYMADYGAGHYSWDGKYIRSARGDMPGMRYLTFLLLRRCHPEITLEIATKIVQENPLEVGMGIAWALGNSQAPSSNDGAKNGTKTMTNPTTLD